MLSIYERIGENYKQDTIREISYTISDKPDSLSVDIWNIVLYNLIAKAFKKEVIKEGIKFSKALYRLKRFIEQGKVSILYTNIQLLDQLLEYLEKLNKEDSYKQDKIELLVYKMQYCNSVKCYQESKVSSAFKLIS